MILELCDFPLKDWLANLSEISTDDHELMLNFTLNIAQGVAHLHTHKVTYHHTPAHSQGNIHTDHIINESK
jgi:hypothetical protein